MSVLSRKILNQYVVCPQVILAVIVSCKTEESEDKNCGLFQTFLLIFFNLFFIIFNATI